MSYSALAGIASLTINGVNYDVVGDLKCDPSNQKIETLIGQSGIQGRKITPKAGKISGTLRDNPAITVADFQGMTNVTVIAITASGKTYSGSAMWWVGDGLEVDTMEASFPVAFEGQVDEG